MQTQLVIPGARHEIDPAFGHWLAGFFAGEGWVGIHRISGGAHYACRACINVRRDDIDVLQLIQRHTGVGRLNLTKPQGNSNPGVGWRVGSLDGCLRLVEIFDEFPLRAKKARDFAYWREAVLIWHSQRGTVSRDWSPIVELKRRLEDGRAYVEPEA